MRDNDEIKEMTFLEFKKGDQRSFSLIFKSLSPYFIYFAKRILGEFHEELSIEAVSGAFQSLWENRNKIKSNPALRPFLYRTVKNKCIDILRANKRSKTDSFSTIFYAVKGDRNRKGSDDESLSDLESADIFYKNHSYNSWEESIIETEVVVAVYKVIETLPTECKKIIKLKYIEGLSNKEISDKLNVTISTVKNHSVRGLKLMRDRIKKIELFSNE